MLRADMVNSNLSLRAQIQGSSAQFGKKTAETGRRNCVVLPQIIGRYPQNGNIFTFHCAPVLHVSGRSTGSRVVKTFFKKGVDKTGLLR